MKLDFPVGAVVVFGGSGGIGRGVALEFAKSGTSVAICYRSKQDVAQATAEDIRSYNVAASVHETDVRNSDSVQSVISAVAAEHGRIHTIVWAAGPVVPQIYIAEWTDDQFRNAVETEVFGFYNAARASIPHFRENGGGSIVHLGSAGHEWWPKLDGLSVAPKAANESLLKGIAKEEGRYNIRANSILVGVIDAGQFKLGQEEGYFDEAWERETKKLLALPRWGTPADVAAAAIFFASNQGQYVTGQSISVSGGFGV